MNVRELRDYLKSVPDDYTVVRPGRNMGFIDISYTSLDTAIERDGRISENHFDALPEGETRIKVLVLE